jgi:dTDP-L-rhamnose 4-epimerase
VQCLITGGAGFIGCRLAERLLAAGHAVTVFDSLHPQVHSGPPNDLPSEAALFAADVTDAGAWDRLVRLHGLPDAVFDLAAETGTGQSLREASRHGSVNVVGTTQLIDALARHEHRPTHVLLTSSRAVYGEGAWSSATGTIFYPPPRTEKMLAAGTWDPVAEDGSPAVPLPHRADTTWPRPVNVYAATKLAQEHVLDAWCSAFDVPLSVLRLQNVYGPGQALANSYTGVLTFFATQLASGASLDVYEDGRIVRDFVYVDDVVAALVAALDRPPSGSRRVDIGSGSASTLLDVAATMTSIAAGANPVVSGRYRPGDVRAASADITAARAELGWSPQTELGAGLEALLTWVTSEL